MSAKTSPAKAAKAKAGKSAKPKGKAAAKAGGKAKAKVKPRVAEAQEAPPGPKAGPSVEPPGLTGPKIDLGAMTVDQRAVVEKLSMNLARAALTAQGAIAEMALRQADRPAALSPDPFHVAPALTEVLGRLAAQPDRLMRAQADLFSQYMELWQATARRMSGETPDPVASPARGDKRFADPDWAENPVFDVIKQSYLLTANWMNGLVAEVDDVDPMVKRRVEFFMKMLTDAF
jgi:polyhydroxyalkanoate synthase